MGELLIFLIGLMSGAMLVFTEIHNNHIDAKVGNQHTNKIVYTVSIDSNATDSLFGKTWRNK